MSDTKKKSKGFLRLLSPLRTASAAKPRQIDQPVIKVRVADYGSILIQTTDEPFTREEYIEERPSNGRAPSSSGYRRDLPGSYRNDTASGSGSAHRSGSSTPITPISLGETTGTPDMLAPPANARPELEITGTIEITMPPHLGQRRVKAIRVGLSAKTKLHMGKIRGWEEDEIFHRKMEMKGDDGSGIVLDPGSQVCVSFMAGLQSNRLPQDCVLINRFAFTLFIPDTIPVHDWFPTAICGLTLYAEIEGLAPAPPPISGHRPSPPTSRSRSRSATPFASAPTSGTATPAAASRSGSPSRVAGTSRSRLPSRQGSAMVPGPEAGHGLNSLMERLEDMSVTSAPVPHAPPYAATNGVGMGSDGTIEAAAPWWTGTARTGIPFEILYNPNPAGGVTELNLRLLGEQDGLGGYRIDLTSQIVRLPISPLHGTHPSYAVLLGFLTGRTKPDLKTILTHSGPFLHRLSPNSRFPYHP